MKKYICILIFFFASKTNFAQQDSTKVNNANWKKSIGMNYDILNMSIYTMGICSFDYRIFKNKSEYNLGINYKPYVKDKLSIDDCYNVKSSCIGLDFLYQYYPNPENKIFKVYFF